jgi:hypothetical protein
MNIVNSVMPSFIPSANVSIPTGQPFPNLNPNSNADSNSQTYYSSVINTDNNPILTLQTHYDQYYGNVIVEGSTIVDGDWYPITTATYSNVTDTYGYVVRGYHPYIRMQFVSNTGAVTNILAR